jgi:hypothetical protein
LIQIYGGGYEINLQKNGLILLVYHHLTSEKIYLRYLRYDGQLKLRFYEKEY